MKSKDIRNLVLSKYENSDGPTKICHDLNGGISLKTVKRWCKMIVETDSIEPSYSPDRPRIARTKGIIQKEKSRLKRKKRVSIRKLSNELDRSKITVQRILKNDLGCRAYKKTIEQLLTDDHKIKRKKFAN